MAEEKKQDEKTKQYREGYKDGYSHGFKDGKEAAMEQLKWTLGVKPTSNPWDIYYHR